MTHIYTVEKIYNFTCSKCKNWWSYASSQNGLPLYLQQNSTCPHCGHRDSVGENAKARIQATADWVKKGRPQADGGNPGLA